MCIFKKNERFYNKKEMFLLFKTETRKNAPNTAIMSNIIHMSRIAMSNIILVFDIVIMLEIAKKRYKSANFVLFGIVQA